MKRVVTLMLLLVLLGQSGVAWAQDDAARPPSGAAQAGLAVASGVATFVYIPIKGLLCLFGGVAAVLAIVPSGPQATEGVGTAACKGSWAITPGMLSGKESFVPVQMVPGVPAEP